MKYSRQERLEQAILSHSHENNMKDRFKKHHPLLIPKSIYNENMGPQQREEDLVVNMQRSSTLYHQFQL